MQNRQQNCLYIHERGRVGGHVSTADSIVLATVQ